MKNMPGLTPSQIESMRAVVDGADVLSYGIAMDLRAVEKAHPEFIRIGKRQGRYKATQQLPYFGAILTEAGCAAIGLVATL